MGASWDTFKCVKNTKSQVVKNLGTNMKVTTNQQNKEFQEFFTAWGSEALRVTKPGAFMFCCMTPRQDLLSRAIVGLEDAGWKVSFSSIYWTYASGFPKSANMGKKADKVFGVKSEIVSTEKFGGSAATLKGKANREDWYDQGEGGTNTPIYERKTGTSEAGRKLEGSYGGCQLKPAVEVILVCMKPMDKECKTFISQALKNNHGITWLDDCRIPYDTGEEVNVGGRGAHGMGEEAGYGFKPLNNISKPVEHVLKYEKYSNGGYKSNNSGSIFYGNQINIDKRGRFPANLLVSDDVLNDGVERTAFQIRSKAGFGNSKLYNHNENNILEGTFGYNDKGSYSRYFDLDKVFNRFCDIYPTLRELENQDYFSYIYPLNNNAYTSLEYDVSQLFHNMNKAEDLGVLYNSLYKSLLSNDVSCVQIQKQFQDFLVDYPSYSHLYDERARLLEGISQEFVQLLIDVHKHIRFCSLRGDLDKEQLYIDDSYAFFLSCLLLPIIIKIRKKSKLNFDDLPENIKKTFPFLIVPKASKGEKNKGCEELEMKVGASMNSKCANCDGNVVGNRNPCKCDNRIPVSIKPYTKNNHPTVKPLRLMSYLITMGSRPGDIVLDPFAGSGTTLLAAKELGRKYIGCELSTEYIQIINARLNNKDNPFFG